MRSPFPGMNPYLERADLWPNVHNSLIIALRDDLGPRLRPRYYVAVEERVVALGLDDLAFVARPDVAVVQAGGVEAATVAPQMEYATGGAVMVEVPLPDEVRELYLEIHDHAMGHVVTVVEVLSPSNKQAGAGRRQYERKRMDILGSMTSLVEIDLLRAGAPMLLRGYQGQSDYRILVSRAAQRPRAELYPFSIREPVPPFRLPLQPDDNEPELAITPLLHQMYERAGYDLRIDYRAAPPPPPLSAEDAAWVAEQVGAA